MANKGASDPRAAGMQAAIARLKANPFVKGPTTQAINRGFGMPRMGRALVNILSTPLSARPSAASSLRSTKRSRRAGR